MRIGKKAKRIPNFLFFFLCLLVIVALVYGIFAYKKFYVTEVTIAPDTYTQVIGQFATDTLHTKRLQIIPANHILFIPSSYLKHRITAEHQEIASVNIHYKSLQHIELDLTLRKPLFRLENGLAVDIEGVVYQEPTDISKLPMLSFVTHFPNKNELVHLQEIASRISVRLGTVVGITIDANKDVHYFFKNNLDTKDHFVVTTLNGEMDSLWSTLLSALDTEPLASLLKNTPSALEYVDLRFGNKVFYKFGKGSNTTHGTSTTTTTGVLAEPHQ